MTTGASLQQALMRDVEHLRQQVATLRVEQSRMGSDTHPQSESSIFGPASPTAVSIMTPPRLTESELNSRLRTEVAALRKEMARLRAEALGIVRGGSPYFPPKS